MKTHQGLKKRFRKTKPKSGKVKLVHQSKGRGSRHLKTKQTNKRKRRIRTTKKIKQNKSLKRAVAKFKTN
ncbi:MAG: 50S ribosomal protein L35 [Candidatus Dojkabacteria bacterium]|nr:50S ribosomal protein L35 [Candidatus Dojkabacteria bacterium]